MPDARLTNIIIVQQARCFWLTRSERIPLLELPNLLYFLSFVSGVCIGGLCIGFPQ